LLRNAAKVKIFTVVRVVLACKVMLKCGMLITVEKRVRLKT